MQLLIVTSPATFLAFNYIVYGSFMCNRVGRDFCLIQPARLARVFVLSDFLTFVIQVSRIEPGACNLLITFYFQGAGGAIETGHNDGTLGSNILLIGLILQIMLYLFFVTLILYTHTERCPRRIRSFDMIAHGGR